MGKGPHARANYQWEIEGRRRLKAACRVSGFLALNPSRCGGRRGPRHPAAGVLEHTLESGRRADAS